jgi:hypothetical protein
VIEHERFLSESTSINLHTTTPNAMGKPTLVAKKIIARC